MSVWNIGLVVSANVAQLRAASRHMQSDIRRVMNAQSKQYTQAVKYQKMQQDAARNSLTALAVEALKTFQTRKIDDLIVVNARREPVGLIDSQDLPKLKLA